MARELALAQLPSNIRFEEALNKSVVLGQYSPEGVGPGIYDKRFLAIDLETYIPSGMTLDEFFGTLPIVNRALRPLMFFDTIEVNGSPRQFLRYPGTLVQLDNTTPGSGSPFIYTVVVPELTYSGSNSTIVRWLPVVQEIRSAAPGTLTAPGSEIESPFHAGSPEGGIAAIRINVPFQATASGGRSLDTSDPQELFETGFQNAVLAGQTINVASNMEQAVEGGATLVQSDSSQNSGAYAGSFGLGSLKILGKDVRPWRKILMAQSIFRREVFAD